MNERTEELRELFIETTGTDTVTEEQEAESKSIVPDEERQVETLPKTSDVTCNKCGNKEAGWYTEQTRAADESETRFFICTECGNKWRGYD